MSIQLYDRGAVIIRNNTKHYLVKHGSKNSFTCPYQTRTDNHFKRQYLRREARDSDWHVVARGEGKMADTSWNAPTGYIYGRILFGNKYNIALYLDKVKPIDYETLSEEQKYNVDVILNWYVGKGCVIDLADIKPEQKMKDVHNYCGKEFHLAENSVTYKGKTYWKLDNL